METGDIVEIFKNPVIKRKAEGKAKLLRHIKTNDLTECWEVEFISNKCRCFRWIKIKEMTQ